MALDDYVESEVAIAVAATAAIFSPRVRGALRTGAIYGLAGALVASDAVGSFARGVGRGVHQAARTTADAAGDAAGAITDTTEPAVHAGMDGGATTPTTPDAAADEVAVVAQGTTDATPTSGRRSRRAHAAPAEGAPHE